MRNLCAIPEQRGLPISNIDPNLSISTGFSFKYQFKIKTLKFKIYLALFFSNYSGSTQEKAQCKKQ